MNLIRNGGFERGDTDFWEMGSAGVLVIEPSLPKYGGFCGKLTSSGAVLEYVRNIDYISVSPLQLFKWSLWTKSLAARGIGLTVWKYDADYSLIGTYSSDLKEAAATWKQASFEYLNTPDVAYIRAGLYVYLSAADEIFYIDNLMFNSIDKDNTFIERVELFDESSVTVSGDSSGDKKDMQAFTTFYADIDVEITGGTNETLDVCIKETDGNGKVIIVGTFAQAIAVGTERIVLSNTAGRSLYIDYVIGGTNPTFNFEVAVTGKR